MRNKISTVEKSCLVHSSIVKVLRNFLLEKLSDHHITQNFTYILLNTELCFPLKNPFDVYIIDVLQNTFWESLSSFFFFFFFHESNTCPYGRGLSHKINEDGCTSPHHLYNRNSSQIHLVINNSRKLQKIRITGDISFQAKRASGNHGNIVRDKVIF